MEADEAEKVATVPPSPPPSSTSSSPLPSSQTPWRVGTRLESKARDTSGGEQWFPAKVLEVEPDGRGVLVHYFQWNARHDEWIPGDSSRLRRLPNQRHDSGSSNHSGDTTVPQVVAAASAAAASAAAAPIPAVKDFKSGECVMATWKLNRKYPATVIRLETDGTYLVEFYDGVQCNVKPNNMRRPRKGEEQELEQALNNGNDSASETEDTSPSASKRRERKQKFDVKKLLNIRTAREAREASKSDKNEDEGGSSRSSSRRSSVESKKTTTRRSDRVLGKNESSKKNVTSNGKPPSSKANNSQQQQSNTSKTALKDGPAMAAVTGKRERKRKKFWDEQVATSAPPPAKVTRKSQQSNVKEASKKRDRRSSGGNLHKGEAATTKESSVIHPGSSDNDNEVVPSVKENGKVLQYKLFDLTSEDPKAIADKMVEGVNIPGMGKPIPMDSSSLPKGWEKRVIQRRIGITKGKWDVFITNPASGKSFRSKTELQKYLDEKKMPYTSDAFDFSLDDNLKRLRQIWKQYKVKPMLNAAAAAAAAAITSATSTNTNDNNKSSEDKCNSVPNNNSSGSGIEAADPADDSVSLAVIGVESETGQGLRCSIPKCGKLFRNNHLLQQHIKHYHPKVFDALADSEPELQPPLSPVANNVLQPSPSDVAVMRRSSESEPKKRKVSIGGSNVALEQQQQQQKRPKTQDTTTTTTSLVINEDLPISKSKRGPGRPAKKSANDSDSPSLPFNIQQQHQSRTRTDSILSVGSVPSDADEPQVDSSNRCALPLQGGPPTPPTFRLSKRRQAQMRRRVHQPVVRVSRVEDTPLGKDLKDELLSMAAEAAKVVNKVDHSPLASIVAAPSSSSYPPSEMDASVAGSEHLTSEEVVNCTCKRTEEDGLMIQCDICLCWQHGYCVGLDDEDAVPDKHVCETCKNPLGGRSTSRFALDQDWLKEGKLPSARACLVQLHQPRIAQQVQQQQQQNMAEKETAFRKLSELMADLSNLSRVLHALRVKLHVASQPSNSKVFMWSSLWEPPQKQQQAEATSQLPRDDDLGNTKTSTPSEAAAEVAAGHSQDFCKFDPQAVANKLNFQLASEPSATATGHFESQMTVADAAGDTTAEQQPSQQPEDDATTVQQQQDDQQQQDGQQQQDEKQQQVCQQQQDEKQQQVCQQQQDGQQQQVCQQQQDGQQLQDGQQQQQSLTEDGAAINMNVTETEKAANDVVKEEEKTKDDDGEKVVQPPVVNGEQNSTSDSPGNDKEDLDLTMTIDNVDEEEENDNMIDPSMIPSVSEVERLLPSVIEASLELVEGLDDNSAHSPHHHHHHHHHQHPPNNLQLPPPPLPPPVIIPEPKRLDRDECRLNLLHHIESVQTELDVRFSAIEAALVKLENSPASVVPVAPSDTTKIKAMLTMLLQDMAIARSMMWSL